MDTKNNIFYFIIIFIIFPFVGLINAIRNFKIYYRYIIAFFGYYGFILVYTKGMDAYRYELSLKNYYNLGFEEILRLEDDLYFKVIVYLVSRITNNPQWMFLVFSLIYGWVFVYIIKAIREMLPEKLQLKEYYWMLAIVLLIPFSSIGGVRFPTAQLIMILAWIILATAEQRTWKPLILGFISVLVHWSFVFPLIFLIFSYLNKNNLKIIYLFLIISLVFRFIPFFDISDIINSFGAQAENKFAAYSSNNVIETRLDSLAATKNYVAKRFDLFLLFINLSLGFQFFFIMKQNASEFFKKIFGVTLVAYSLLNMVINNPYGKDRFITLTIFLGLVSTLCFFLEVKNKKVKNIILYSSVAPVALMIWVNTRLNFETMDMFLIVGNPIVALIIESKTSLLSLLGLG